ncbi:copper homeostasis protein CutC, partial [Rhizobium leguminosarum]
ATGAREVLGSCSSPFDSAAPRAVAFGFVARITNKTDVAVVRQLRRAIEAGF